MTASVQWHYKSANDISVFYTHTSRVGRHAAGLLVSDFRLTARDLPRESGIGYSHGLHRR